MLASRQHGMVNRSQLLGIGFNDRAISRRIAHGRLIRRHRGVYAVGHVPDTPEARWTAAVLACLPHAVLSHRSAARAHGIVTAEGVRPSLTVPPGRKPRHPGIEIHRATLDPADVTRNRGIPITTVARTLVDLATILDGRALRATVRESQYQRIFDLDAVLAALVRTPRRKLSAIVTDPEPSTMTIQQILPDICRRNGIRDPEEERRIGPKRVDFVWLPEMVVVETDGWRAHGTRDAYQEDRTAGNELQLLGYHVLRFTWRDVTRRRRYVATTIRRALRTRAIGPTTR